MSDWRETWEDDRHRPLPSLLEVPGHLWQTLGRRGHIAVALAALALVLLAVAFVPGAVRNGDENRVNEVKARAAAVRARAATLARLQRPHATRLTGAVARDARAPAARHALERSVAAGLGMPATCEVNHSLAASAADASFACLATSGARRSGNYRIEFGQRARGRIRASAGGDAALVAWCRDFPRPLHPDTGGYVEVSISPQCEGPPAR